MQTSEHLLHDKSIRPTAMRLLLLEYFIEHKTTPFSLTELEAAFPKSDRITIYRTLKTFEENGVLHTIEQGSSGNKYALCEDHCNPDGHLDRHPHFHCTVCDQVQCLEESFIPPVNVPVGYQVQEVNMIIKGICMNCKTR
jgi:Fur family ferric uptake transcriptional regulator